MTHPHQGAIRGSQKLLASLAGNEEAIPSPEEIKKAFGLAHIEDLKVTNWLIRGIPPAYLTVAGELQAPVSRVSEVVDKFIALNDSSINLKILINGIPFPEIARIVVGNAGEE